jgi:hypothetical protein
LASFDRKDLVGVVSHLTAIDLLRARSAAVNAKPAEPASTLSKYSGS